MLPEGERGDETQQGPDHVPTGGMEMGDEGPKGNPRYWETV